MPPYSLQGQGIYISANGGIYCGDFINNKVHGKNIYYYLNGSLNVGDFDSGKLISKTKVLQHDSADAQMRLNDFNSFYKSLVEIHAALERKTDAFKYELCSLEIRKYILSEDREKLAIEHSDVGVKCTNTGWYDKALSFGLSALEMRESVLPENNIDLALSCNNIGKAHEDLKNYDKSLEYLSRALKIIKLNENECMFAGNVHCNIGITYSFLGNEELAIQHLLLAEDLLCKQKNIFKLSKAYQKLIEIYQAQEKTTEADVYNQRLNELNNNCL